MRYFDSRDMPLGVGHIMASAALPPAFPPVRIDGELYWDGGILSNTPTEAVFDDNPRRSALIFAGPHVASGRAGAAEHLGRAHRYKDIQYSSRINNHIARQLADASAAPHHLGARSSTCPKARSQTSRRSRNGGLGVPDPDARGPLLAPRLDNEDHIKDMDFSPAGIRQRWEAGYAHTKAVLAREPWVGQFDPLSGVILHRAKELTALAAE